MSDKLVEVVHAVIDKHSVSFSNDGGQGECSCGWIRLHHEYPDALVAYDWHLSAAVANAIYQYLQEKFTHKIEVKSEERTGDEETCRDCGREYTSVHYIEQAILSVWKAHDDNWVAQGGAKGADTLANKVAEMMGLKGMGVRTKTYHADWAKYGKAAGMIRNKEMLDDFKPDVVLAFYKVGAGNIGTMGCVNEALKRGIPVRIYPEK